MITDNDVHPKTYRVTKLMDTFPLGNIKVILSQSHYNEHTDLCGKDAFFADGKVHYICDFKESTLPPLHEIDVEPKPDILDNIIWRINGGSEKLYIHGSTMYLEAVPDATTTTVCNWHIFIDGKLYSKQELVDYFDIDDSNANLFSIKAINKVMAKYIVSIGLYNNNCVDKVPLETSDDGIETRKKQYLDFIEMEVAI